VVTLSLFRRRGWLGEEWTPSPDESQRDPRAAPGTSSPGQWPPTGLGYHRSGSRM